MAEDMQRTRVVIPSRAAGLLDQLMPLCGIETRPQAAAWWLGQTADVLELYIAELSRLRLVGDRARKAAATTLGADIEPDER